METVIVLCVLAWLLKRWVNVRAADYDRARRQILEERLLEQPVRLSVEQMGNMLYCWDTATMDFVCQGRDLEEIRKNFALRYPNRNAAIAQGPEELVTKLKQELQALKQNENFSSQ